MEDRNVANEILTTITSVLSLFGTLFIIISFFIWKDIRTTSRRILVYISVADFFTSVATIAAATNFWLSGSENPQVCIVQSVIGTLSVLCSFFWTVSMAVYLYICVCMKKSRLAERLLYAFHVCSWGIPVLIVTLAASLNKLGDNGNKVSAGWCWVDINLNWSDQVLWMLLAGKLWEVIAYVVIAVLYALLKRNMKKEVCSVLKAFFFRNRESVLAIIIMELHHKSRVLTQSTVVQAQKAERKLIFVPLLFVFLRIWGTIRFFLLIADGPDSKSYDWLLILQGIGDNAPGFANFLLFCFFTEKFLGNIRWCLESCRIHSAQKNQYVYPSSFSATYGDDVTNTQDPIIINKDDRSRETDCLKGQINPDYSSMVST